MKGGTQCWSYYNEETFRSEIFFHLDATTGNRCSIFITNDSQLVKMINETGLISVARPAELDKKLAELGIRPIILP